MPEQGPEPEPEEETTCTARQSIPCSRAQQGTDEEEEGHWSKNSSVEG